MNNTDMKARSPWSKSEYAAVEFSSNLNKIQGEVSIPGSKSYTNRAIIIASFAQGETILKGILKSDDSYWCIDSLKKLGVEIHEIEDNKLKIIGIGNKLISDSNQIYIGAAGTNARFLPGLLAAHSQVPQIITASKRMSERPIEPLVSSLEKLGLTFKYLENKNHYPIEIIPSTFKGGIVHISGKVSSQFISGLLIAAPKAKNNVKIAIDDSIVQKSYVQITIDLMGEFGVKVIAQPDFSEFSVESQNYIGTNLNLEADISTACYFFALAAISGKKVEIKNINLKTSQPDIEFLDVLEMMGCKITRKVNSVLVEGPKQLKGGFSLNMKEMSDQALTIAALAPFSDGPINIYGVEHIRTHESDRIAVMTESLRKLGVKVKEEQDGWTIYPQTKINHTNLDTYDDHRVAMSLSLIALKVGNIIINDPGCVSKTCPDFFDMLKSLGVQLKYIKGGTE